MQLLIEELEPIVTATQSCRSLPTSLPSCKAEEEEPSLTRRLDRVARLCAAQIHSIDRSHSRIGRYASRLVRHYDRERGLTALAARITEAHGKIVSRQYLGQALCVFEAYTNEETENRFSRLTNTHLLKAAQGCPAPSERDTRNALLDRAAKDKASVAELVTAIKAHRAAKVTADSTEPSPPTDEAPVEEARGYVCGDEVTELATLSDRGVGFLRGRETVTASDAITEAGRVLSPTGLMIVELSTVEGYIDAHKAVNESGRLRILHTLIVIAPANHRPAPRDLPVTDCFSIAVLIGGYGFHHSQSHPKYIDNPMSEADADELIYSLVPDSGLVVDIGTGSAQTAEWAKAHGREYLAVEPNEDVYGKNLVDLEAVSPAQTSGEPTPPTTPDSWSMVTESQREQASIDGTSWDSLSCCERTQIAVLVSGRPTMVCPACGNKCTAKLGAVSC